MTSKPFRVFLALAALLLGAARADADLIVAENSANDTLRLTDTGTLVTTFAGNGQTRPIGVGLDSASNVYVVNNGNDSVSQFSPTGAPLGFFGGFSGATSPLSTPVGIAFTPNGNVYVTNTNTFTPAAPGPGYVAVFNSAGVLQGSFGATTTNVPTGIGFNPTNGLLYVSNAGSSGTNANTVLTYNPANLGAGPTLFTAAVETPEQIAFDAAGNVYIANFAATTGVSNVREFSTSGVLIRTFTPTGATAAGADGVAVDPAGNVYVSLFNRGTIEKFSPTGVNLGAVASNLRGPSFLQYVNPQAVPEPGSLALAAVALAGAAGYQLRRRRAGRAA